ncbi:hypothetical protein J6590_065124 [Homalodisca vitripennis]|nr:hypothetical protein J6590_065124 [Homalodisca vitripennis]
MDSTQGESPGKGGRKNIRKVLTKHELAAATKAAAKEEEERKKRIAARQKLFNEMFEIKEAEVLQKLVLDFDPETKTELISVDHDLVTKMKPHQYTSICEPFVALQISKRYSNSLQVLVNILDVTDATAAMILWRRWSMLRIFSEYTKFLT